ncbi:unnamed protein product [Oppiella nova]|uniref:DH domain-containing protein n=1 Tax=Oppiella nova TaxID=334625 RepID=A0A7R9QXB8_9ACAR|nr:unnamed protein product [Oppiella nova]CAG2177846.1 unnamed protein product [Oppiella nova]
MISYQNIYEQLHHITDYVQNIRLPHTYPIQPYLQTIHDNRLYLAITVSGVTFLTTLLIMGKWRRMTRSIRSIVLRTSSSRSEKYDQIRTEIMESEERHVNVLEYIQSMFYKPLEREGLLTPDQLANVFSNTKQVLEIHRQVLQGLQSSKKPFEKTIYAIFSGPLGTQMEQEVGLFCTKHKLKE